MNRTPGRTLSDQVCGGIVGFLHGGMTLATTDGDKVVLRLGRTALSLRELAGSRTRISNA